MERHLILQIITTLPDVLAGPTVSEHLLYVVNSGLLLKYYSRFYFEDQIISELAEFGYFIPQDNRVETITKNIIWLNNLQLNMSSMKYYSESLPLKIKRSVTENFALLLFFNIGWWKSNRGESWYYLIFCLYYLDFLILIFI